ncbi:MAG: FHA domain-containing protein [Kiritimatiellae bacterium]|nr:FHA domain-containing protein [Kiritimatiellia bacterium]
MLQICVEKGGPQGEVFTLSEGNNLIGRSLAANLRLTDSDVSRKHVMISVSGSTAVVENLSQRGTLLNGKPLNAPAALEDGHRLALGRETILLFQEIEETVFDEEPATSDSAGKVAAALVADDALTRRVAPVAAGAAAEGAPRETVTDAAHEFVVPAQATPAAKRLALDEPETVQVHVLADPAFDPEQIAFEALPDGRDAHVMERVSGYTQLVGYLEPPRAGAAVPEPAGETPDGAQGPHTRMVSPELVEYLGRVQKRKAMIRKGLLIGGIALGVLVMIVLLWVLL